MARTKDRARQSLGEVSAPLFRTATYARLSVESSLSESGSIQSQQMLMRDYLKEKKEFYLVGEYKEM